MEQGKKIHSTFTKLNKIFWVIFLFALPAFALFAIRDLVLFTPYFIQVVIILGIVPAYFLFIKPILSTADEAYDYGSYILIKKNHEQMQINLDEIINIRYPASQNQLMFAALKINRSTKFGEEILFMPQGKLFKSNAYKNEVIDDLIIRIDEAKRKK